jgi:hypothetical protein
MTLNLEISEALYLAAKLAGEKDGYSVSEQVQYWAKVGKACIDNPDLPIHFIQDALASFFLVNADPWLLRPSSTLRPGHR